MGREEKESWLGPMSSQADRILVRRRAGPASGQPASALIEEEREGTAKEQRCFSFAPAEGERRRASERAAWARESQGLLHAALRGQGSLRLRRTDCLVARRPRLALPPSLALRRCVSCVQLLECQFQANSRGERSKDGRCVGPTDQPPTAVLSASFARSLGLSLSTFDGRLPKIAAEFLGECYF